MHIKKAARWAAFFYSNAKLRAVMPAACPCCANDGSVL
jgi:hypothetical protein